MTKNNTYEEHNESLDPRRAIRLRGYSRRALLKYVADPYSPENQSEFIKTLHANGLAEQANQRFVQRGRGMLAGPFFPGQDSSFFAFDYATEGDVAAKRGIDAEVRAKVLEFLTKYDPATEWVVMLVIPDSGTLVSLQRCRR